MSLTLFHPYVIGPKGVLCVKMGWKVWLTDNGAVRYGLRLPCQKGSIACFEAILQEKDPTYHHLQCIALGRVSWQNPHQHMVMTPECKKIHSCQLKMALPDKGAM